MSQLCPCGSGLDYSLCCQPYLRGERVAERASQLMRSRYTAFVVHDVDWLIASWHTSCQAAQMRESITAGFANTHWLGLTIFDESPEKDGESFVSFVARYEENGVPGAIIERSRFLKEQGQWYYIDGVRPTFGRNDLCPCGSGKKFKKCCAY